MTILPAITTIERLCADALVAAERRIEKRIAARLDPVACDGLDRLTTEMLPGAISRFIWLRRIEPGNNSAAANRLLDRQIGRAQCRERVCQYGSICAVAAP